LQEEEHVEDGRVTLLDDLGDGPRFLGVIFHDDLGKGVDDLEQEIVGTVLDLLVNLMNVARRCTWKVSLRKTASLFNC
jgi:hypothetical protein